MFQVFSKQNRMWRALVKRTDAAVGANIAVTKGIFSPPFAEQNSTPVTIPTGNWGLDPKLPLFHH